LPHVKSHHAHAPALIRGSSRREGGREGGGEVIGGVVVDFEGDGGGGGGDRERVRRGKRRRRRRGAVWDGLGRGLMLLLEAAVFGRGGGREGREEGVSGDAQGRVGKLEDHHAKHNNLRTGVSIILIG
jgi:hypothetical protein